MDEKRLQKYLELVEKLLSCSTEEEINQILVENKNLLDVGFLRTIVTEAEKASNEGDESTANRLRYLANARDKALNSSPNVPKASPTVNVEHNLESLSEAELQSYEQFLEEVLRATFESQRDAQVVYPLLAANIDKLNANLAELLQRWIKIFEEVEATKVEHIAIAIGNFSYLISDFPLGNKANNIEIAITGYEAILTFFTKGASPEIWASVQNCLGNAYLKRIKGNKADNIDKAIAFFEAALEVYTRKDFPQNWAITQLGFGNAYTIRIKGNKADNIDKAIAFFEAALEVYTRKDFPQNWAITQLGFGNAYLKRIKGNKADNIDKAIAAYNAALEVCTRKDFPQDWATIQNNLGLAYWERIKGNKADNIDKAIAAYNAALKVCTRKDFPQDWARTQNNLGNAYTIRIKGNKADNIDKAIAAYNAALEVCTRKDFPQNWADTQNNLGNAYFYRIKGDKADNIDKAIAFLEAALEVYTRNELPQNRADTQNNLGFAYTNRIKGDKADNIEKAIAFLEAALEVYTRYDFPQDWANTHNNLGAAYFYRIKGDKEDNFEKAIAAYNAALEVYTRYDFPQDWAKTQNNFGNAYTIRIKGDKEDNIEKAIAAYNAALEVYTRYDFPQDWADTQNNLGAAYFYRIKGDKEDNIKKAITFLKAALEIRTPTALPIECLTTAGNLGNLLFEIERWQESINAYDKAIQAVELSRSWATDNTRRQEILENAINVYINIVQACINNEQPEKAIEYAERSKARNLVELVYDSQLEPKGNIPQKQQLINEFKLLRRQIKDEQRFLNSQAKGLNTNKDEYQRQAENEQLEESRQRLEQLQQQLDELLETKIQPYDPSFSLTQKVEPIQFNKIQSLLDKNTAIIEWYLTKDKITAFLITPKPPILFFGRRGGSINIWQSKSEDLEALIDWVNEYLGEYYNGDDEKNEQWQKQLEHRLKKLAEILHIDEIVAQIPKECDRLIIIPHRFLHILPFHALEVKNSESSINKCLLELFPRGVSYAPSCQLLQLAQNQQQNDFTSLFAIQTPTEDLYKKDLGAVQAIKKQFTDSYISDGANAKKSSIITDEKLIKANCVFFFCHGYFEPKSPLDSGLILADDKLTLGDLFTQLKLENCRLVTLSACETGLIDFNNTSDEYIGLPSGFIFAGSTNVVSSLWTVNAAATALLMIKFYEELQQQNSIVLSLNKAQLWLRDTTIKGFQGWLKNSLLSEEWQKKLNNSFTKIEANKGAMNKPFESPYFWSAFCAIGKGE